MIIINCSFVLYYKYLSSLIHPYQSWYSDHSLLYIYFACLFVSNKRQNGCWTIRVQIPCGTWHDPMGRFMDDRNFKNLPPTKIDFHYIFKIHDFFIICDFFCFTMYTKRKCSQLKQKQALFLLKYTLNTIHRIETEASLVLLKYTLNAIRRMKKKQA